MYGMAENSLSIFKINMEKILRFCRKYVNDTNARALIEYTGITQVHSSCGSWKCDVTAAEQCSGFSYDEAMKNCYQCADAGKVRKLAEEVSGV